MLVPQEMGGGGKEVQLTWMQDDPACPWYGPEKRRMGQVVRSNQPVLAALCQPSPTNVTQLAVFSWLTPEQPH